MQIQETDEWQALAKHYAEVRDVHLRELFGQDADRATKLSADAVDVHLDYSKHRITGETLLALLECRLDNVLVRLGFAASRRQARQLISHGHWTVNGRRVNIPSYQVRPGEVIAIKADTPATQVVRDATELTGQIPAWLQADHESLTAKVLRKPERREVAAPVQEQLIVELYSK